MKLYDRLRFSKPLALIGERPLSEERGGNGRFKLENP